MNDDQISNLFYFSSKWDALDVDGLADVNANTSADLVVFAKHLTKGTIRGDVRDSMTGDLIQSMNFLGSPWSPRAFAVFNDIDGNGIQELGVIARKDDGTIKVQLRDALTGETVKTINIP